MNIHVRSLLVTSYCQTLQLVGLIGPNPMAVFTNWHTAARAQCPVFFLFEGPQLVVMKLFFKLIILVPSQRSTVRETR